MFHSKLNRIAGVVGALVALAAFAGLAWATTTTSAGSAKHSAHGQHLLCVRLDSDDTPQCLRQGPRGYRGRRGYRGHRGARGPVGFTGITGLTGPVGAQGDTGAQGAQGIQGIQGVQGIQGPPGAFATGGSDAGGNMIEVLGSKIGPITENNGNPGPGTVIQPASVARCPTSGPDQEAYDGGAIITVSNTSYDVVGLQSSYPGLYVGPTEVDPLPAGAPPGGVSQESANAYEAQAVVTQMANGDTVTFQSYVVCGP